ncbi:MAG: ParB N-terminal domain-containing protein [Maledivibacter sp.]|jgi:hypothetical protein|nr:ParB N-terminal domain-containing protein [Maledivibacter sp.]
MPIPEKVSVNKLLLWEENPRHTTSETQKEAISQLVTGYGDKIYNLAKDIGKNGLIEPLAVLKKDNTYVVYEGNRRLLAMKLIINPDIIKDIDLKMYNKFSSIKKTDNFNDTISVNTYQEKEMDKLLHYVELRHNGELDGKGVIKWNAPSKARFFELRNNKNDKYLIFYRFLKTNNVLSDRDFNLVSKTNWERILLKPGQEFLELVYEGGEFKTSLALYDFKKRIQLIASELAGQNVSRVYARVNQEIFFNEMKERLNLNNKSDGCQQVDMSSLENIEIESKKDTEESKNDDIELKEVYGKTKSSTKSLQFTEPIKSQDTMQRINNKDDDTIDKDSLLDNKEIAENNDVTDLGTKDIKISDKKSSGNNLNCFFAELKNTIDFSQQDNKGIQCIINELEKISSKKLHKTIPIASAFLMRSLLEQSILYLLRERNVLKSIKEKSKGEIPGLMKLIKYVDNHKSNLFSNDRELERCWNVVSKNIGTKDHLDLIVHHPELIQPDGSVLQSIANNGFRALIEKLLTI